MQIHLNWLHTASNESQIRGLIRLSKGERVKIPLLPYIVDKKSLNDSGPTVGSRSALMVHGSLIFGWGGGGNNVVSRLELTFKK